MEFWTQVIKYVSVAFITFVLYHLNYPIINKDVDVRYPKVKINIIKKRLSPREVLQMCALEMLKKHYSREEVEQFVKGGVNCRDEAEFYHYIGHCFYVW